jgi:hypothetical protein
VPDGQAVHIEDPLLDEYVPLGHAVHMDDELAPVIEE